MKSPYIVVQSPIGPLSFTFERRRYGRCQFYCWAHVHNGAEAISLGDPWPASNFPRKELIQAAMYALAGKVLTPAALCLECGETDWHRQGCSLWREAVEVAAGRWESARVEVAA